MHEIIFTKKSCIRIIIFCIIGIIICVTTLLFDDFFIRTMCIILLIILVLCGVYFLKYLNVKIFYT